MIILLYKDIYQCIISFVNKKSDISSILLTCKDFNFMGYKCLHKNFNIDDVTLWACRNNSLSLVEKILKISNIDLSTRVIDFIGTASQNKCNEIVELLLKDPRVAKLYPSGV
jgi:hypothetical protein